MNAISIDQILELEKTLELERLRLAERENAIRVLKEMIGLDPSRPRSNAEIPNFSKMVKDAIKDFKGSAFSLQDIEDNIKNKGGILPDQARAKISTLLSVFKNKGRIEIFEKGKGPAPNKYRSLTH